jgi:DNA polymerase III gamma/tau subunit
MRQAEAIPRSSLITYLDLINQCDIQYARALNKWLHLEMYLVRMCYAHRRQETELPALTVIEKKKPESRTPVKSSNGGYENGKKEIIHETSSAASSSKTSNPSDPGEKLIESISGKSHLLTEDILFEKPSDILIPSLKDIGSIRQKAEIKHEEEKKKVPVLALSSVLDFWKDFAEKHSSPSLRQTMTEAILEIKGDQTIFIRVGNQTGKNRLLNETNLLEGLRGLVKLPDLHIVIDIDADLDRTKDLVKPKNY